MARYNDEKNKQLKTLRAERQAAFNKLVDDLARDVDPVAGFFGPQSASWRMSREGVLFATGMAPLMLQVAHPMVAQSVFDYSKYKEQPLARAYRTFDAVFKIVFGTRDTAVQVAKRTYAIHNAIAGTFDDPVAGYPADYDAVDPDAMLWIYATLMYAVWRGHEEMIGPVIQSERNTWYLESKVFALLFGVPARLLPENFDAFVQYYEGMLASDRILVTPTARVVGEALKQGAGTTLMASAAVRNSVGSYLLPERFRRDFALPDSMASRALARATLRAAAAAARVLPVEYRCVPAYRNALRRMQVMPDRELGRRVDRALVNLVQRVAMPG